MGLITGCQFERTSWLLTPTSGLLSSSDSRGLYAAFWCWLLSGARGSSAGLSLKKRRGQGLTLGVGAAMSSHLCCRSRGRRGEACPWAGGWPLVLFGFSAGGFTGLCFWRASFPWSLSIFSQRARRSRKKIVHTVSDVPYLNYANLVQ